MNQESTGNLEISEFEQGAANLTFNHGGPYVLNLANTELSDSWNTVDIHWQYPNQYLLLIVETPFTKKKTPYKLDFSVGNGFSDFARAVQIRNNEESEIDTSNSSIILENDSNYQVVLKLFATPEHAYTAFIKYRVIERNC